METYCWVTLCVPPPLPPRAAKRLLTEIVEKGRPAPAFHHNDGPGMTVQEIMVPASKAGLVIGKGGETIKSLQVSQEVRTARFESFRRDSHVKSNSSAFLFLS